LAAIREPDGALIDRAPYGPHLSTLNGILRPVKRLRRLLSIFTTGLVAIGLTICTLPDGQLFVRTGKKSAKKYPDEEYPAGARIGSGVW